MEICLKTLPDASAQQVFDHVVGHLRKQGCRAVTADGSCCYLAEDGRRCAGGCLIAPDEYSKEFEGKIWDALPARGLAPYVHVSLIRSLQSSHDICDVDDWEDDFEEIAREFELVYSPVEKGQESK